MPETRFYVRSGPLPPWVPMLGCLGTLAILSLTCLLPLLLVDVMQSALVRLNLHPLAALAAVLGILIGSFVNLPLYRIERRELQPYSPWGVFAPWAPRPELFRYRPDTIVAVNVGGCVVPTLLAVWEAAHLAGHGRWPVVAALAIAAVNTAVCHLAARPVAGIGILMPTFLSPLVAVGLTWLLLGGSAWAPVRPPVAFIAGVAGPLVGADLLNLRAITRASIGLLSIGGAGTFDGIVLSGILAALLV